MTACFIIATLALLRTGKQEEVWGLAFDESWKINIKVSLKGPLSRAFRRVIAIENGQFERWFIKKYRTSHDLKLELMVYSKTIDTTKIFVVL